MVAARSKKSAGKKSGKKKKTAKRVREERSRAFGHGLSIALWTVLIMLLAFGVYKIWDVMGKPGWNSGPQLEASVCLELYFLDNAVYYLVPVHRRVTLDPGETRSKRAMLEFARGPRDPSLARIYPSDLPPPEVWVTGDELNISLPESIWDYMGGTKKESDLLDAITLIVEAAGEHSSVRILIGNEKVETTPEGYDLSEPLVPPEYINHVPDSALQGESRWVTAYFLDSTGRYLIPLSIEVDSNAPDGEIAIDRLLKHPPNLTYPPPLAVCQSGYSLNPPLRIEHNIATLDLNVPDPQTAFMDQDVNLFRRAVFLTLKKSCDVEDVVLKLNGRDLDSYNRFGNLSSLQDGCWNPEPVADAESSQGSTVGGESQ